MRALRPKTSYLTAIAVTLDDVKVFITMNTPLNDAKHAKENHADAVVAMVVHRHYIVIIVMYDTVRNANHGTPPTSVKRNAV